MEVTNASLDRSEGLSTQGEQILNPLRAVVELRTFRGIAHGLVRPWVRSALVSLLGEGSLEETKATDKSSLLPPSKLAE